jgi:hypothetical protein
MKHTLRKIAAAITVAAMVGIFATSPASAQFGASAAACLTPREIQTAIQSGEVQPVAVILTAAGISDMPLSVQLCRQNGRLFYVVAVLGSSGQAQNLTLPADGASH